MDKYLASGTKTFISKFLFTVKSNIELIRFQIIWCKRYTKTFNTYTLVPNRNKEITEAVPSELAYK